MESLYDQGQARLERRVRPCTAFDIDLPHRGGLPNHCTAEQPSILRKSHACLEETDPVDFGLALTRRVHRGVAEIPRHRSDERTYGGPVGSPRPLRPLPDDVEFINMASYIPSTPQQGRIGTRLLHHHGERNLAAVRSVPAMES